MGTLDDAIREHLELKRKQGISQEELEREEAEALGRRQAAPEPPPAAPASSPEPSQSEPLSPEPALDAEPELIEEPDLPAVDPQIARNGSSASEPAPPEPAPPEPAADGADLLDQDLAERSASTPKGVPVVRRARPSSDSEPEGEADEDDPPEDFLEDTPEFLEETPEHDRLWFEQKPPKDFDFD